MKKPKLSVTHATNDHMHNLRAAFARCLSTAEVKTKAQKRGEEDAQRDFFRALEDVLDGVLNYRVRE